MPDYIVRNSGKRYHIPDSLVEEFERDMPDAQRISGQNDTSVRVPDILKQQPVREDPSTSVKDTTGRIRTNNVRRDRAEQEDNNEAIRGFIPGVKQGSDMLYQGLRSAAGETANIFTGSQRDYKRAQEALADLQASGLDLRNPDEDQALEAYRNRQYERDLQNWRETRERRAAEREHMGIIDAIGSKLRDPSRPEHPSRKVGNVADNAQEIRAVQHAVEALRESGGDVRKAYELLGRRANQESWGDRQSREAREALANMKPTEGFSAWLGELVPQMAGTALAVAASTNPWTRPLARPLAAANMAALTASSGGSAMADARRYAEETGKDVSEGEVWNAGVSNAGIEYGTEKIPFLRYMSGAQNYTQKALGKALSDKVLKSSKAKKELGNLLERVDKEFGKGLLSKQNVTEYLKDIGAEGLSEFTAGALQAITPIVYQNPEDYPDLYDALNDAWEGAKAGAFMGAFLGAGSRTVGHYTQDKRRREQGSLLFADTENDGVIEIIAENGDKYTGITPANEVVDVPKNEVRDQATVSYNDFMNGLSQELQTRRENHIRDAQSSYDAGYNEQSPEGMQDIYNRYDIQRQAAAQVLPAEMIDAIERDPDAVLSTLTDDDATSRAALDYINACKSFDGMNQRVQDDIDNRVEQSNVLIDRRTDKDTGTVRKSTLKEKNSDGNDRYAYIVKGNVVPFSDGSGIDRESSDGSIVIIHEDTGEQEMVSPDAILSIDAPIDASQEKEEAAAQIRSTAMQEAYNKIHGIVSFTPGDVYTLTDDSGEVRQAQVVADENGVVGNPDGTVNIQFSGDPTIYPVSREDIQSMVDATNRARVLPTAEQTTQLAEEQRQAPQEQEPSQPAEPANTYQQYDELTLRGTGGEAVDATIIEVDTLETPGEPRYLVDTRGGSIDGKSPVDWYTAEELDSLRADQPVSVHPPVSAPASASTEQAVAPGTTQEAPAQAQPQTPALSRIPVDEQGQPVYEQTDPDTAWDALLEQTEGDEATAQQVADEMVKQRESELKKAGKATLTGSTPAEKIASSKARSAAIAQAQAALDSWKEIASTAQRRRAAQEAARLAQEQAEQERAAREEAERQERESLQGVPDVTADTPQDARARGYRRVNGHLVERQQPLEAVRGKEVQIKFNDKNMPTGHVPLIDASQLQPSHINGQRNPQHFLDEAQPKERNDEASIQSARRIAAHIRPEEITSSVTAYTGAPTVNQRGEAIQGNNRSAALREMWAEHPQEAQRYKQYLMEHASDFGLTAEDVERMEHPVLVNMLDVDDAEAVRLGQFEASDTESGGVMRIKAKNVAQQMGKRSATFSRLLLRSEEEDATLGELLDRNGAETLKWMEQQGFITPTQYRSAFDTKGNLTSEAKNDLKGILFQGIFQGGNTLLEERFNRLPAKAQRAILATAYRDSDSPRTERMTDELQASIEAYYELEQYAPFREAKNYKEARQAAEAWSRQMVMDDVTGEGYLPSERFSNFARLLATMYKGQSQRFVQDTLKQIYDLVQGTPEDNFFEESDHTPRTLVEAINEVIRKIEPNFTYNGQRRSNVLADDSGTSQRGRQGSPGRAPTGERSENGTGTALDNRGAESRSEQRDAAGDGSNGLRDNDRGGTEGSTDARQGGLSQTGVGQREKIRLTSQQTDALLKSMEDNAEEAPEIELNAQSWANTFGENNSISTPFGYVKMGENQLAKFFAKGREKEFGMVAPTLTDPDVIGSEISTV